MKTLVYGLCGIMIFLLAGCASDQGGVSDDYYKGYGTRMREENIRPSASPDDVRDPAGLTVPWRVPNT